MRKSRIAAAALSIAVFLLPSFALAATLEPTLVPNSSLYSRSDGEFESAIVVDGATGKRLYAYLPELKWPGASLTKLMNAVLTVERKPNWNKIVALSSKDEVGGGRLRVVAGSQMSLQDMFYSTLVSSTNNTATALARLSGLGVAGFVKQMNTKAKSLGMTKTKYVDPSGIDPKNITTAHDLAILARTAFGIPKIQTVVSTSKYTFAIRNSSVVKTLNNTDDLLTKDPEMWVLGGKTGFLYESRYNLVVEMKRYPFSPQQPAVYVVVLGSPTRTASFSSAKALAKWAWADYDWR